MNDPSTASAAGGRHPLWGKLLVAFGLLVLVLALVIAFFPWDVLRGPLNRYVSERTGRHFEITRHLDVKLGLSTRVLADGIEFANPDWASDPYLLKADAAEIDIRLLPLLRRHIEIPLLKLTQPQLGLQIQPDGRRSWALGRDTADRKNVPAIGAIVVDRGAMHFLSSRHGADIQTEFAIDDRGNAKLPVAYKARGTWQREAFTANGRTGNVMNLGGGEKGSFPLEINASAAHTTLKASGTVENLATLDGANAHVTLQGANLSELYKLLGVVLPETPRYEVSGHLVKQGRVWDVSGIQGKLGNSDMAGDMKYDKSNGVPMLSGKLHSKSLDFSDLAPLVGLPEQARSAAAMPDVAPVGAGTVAAKIARARTAPGHVLPTAPLDLARLKAMNADVQYSAAKMTNLRRPPVDRMNVHVLLKDGVLQLDPLELGIADGKVAGRLKINGNTDPATAEVKLDLRSLELAELFPIPKIATASFGKIHGLIDLRGRGNSAAQMLATSGGSVSMVMGRGQVSELMMAVAALDGGDVIKLLLTGDKKEELRCAAASFNVTNGVMASRTLMLDTTDTVIYGDGSVSLANETLNLILHPYPKGKSILSLRSPLKLAGSFASPKASVDKAAVVGKAGVALALGVINPLLTLAATLESGPGKDADCRTVLQEAAAPAAAARAVAAGTPATGKPVDSGKPGEANVLGAAKADPQELARQRAEKLERLPQERNAAAAAAAAKR